MFWDLGQEVSSPPCSPPAQGICSEGEVRSPGGMLESQQLLSENGGKEMSYCSSRLDIRKDFLEGGVAGRERPWNLLFWGSWKIRIPSMSCDGLESGRWSQWPHSDTVFLWSWGRPSILLSSLGGHTWVASHMGRSVWHLEVQDYSLALVHGLRNSPPTPTLSDTRGLALLRWGPLGPPAPSGVSLFLPSPKLLLHPHPTPHFPTLGSFCDWR